MNLNDAVALVAGASGGIGRAVSEALLKAGADVFMLGRSITRLTESVPAAAVGKAYCVAADLSAPEATERVAAEIVPRERLDVLVLSSGIYARSVEREVFADQIAANLLGPYTLIQRLLPFLVKAQGQIVFMNSTQGLRATASVGQYAATKHALKAVADSLRDEVNPAGVRVTSIFLGRTATEMQRAVFAAEGRPYRPESLIQPDDVAGVVLALLQLPRTSEITDITLRPMQKT
jgi:NAD(P)-dependent dehydrogenase (short-subunit alcohol dehydrogenase family)